MSRDRALLVIGSFNKPKAAEMAELLQGLDIAIRSLGDFPRVRPVPETGETFAENARQKALGLAQQIATEEVLGVVADDSGLEVEALGGEPGVMSARYAGEGASDEGRCRKVLALLAGVPCDRRGARFRCAAVYAEPDGAELSAEGTVEGRIAEEPAGTHGFGYDPIFIPDGLLRQAAGLPCGLTMAQLSAEEKRAISHRGRAFRALAVLIRGACL
jgi:XTP/dITP diphosphohydrolase